ncbi:MAG: DEAD/DEAH box helicase [Gemmatimonadota bacterium]
MDSFEDFGVAPELVEALTSEGIEVPTPLQEDAIPLLRNGNNLVLAAGAGSGLLAAWAVPLLDRITAEEAGTCILVITGDRSSAVRQAESIARLTRDTAHVVAALGTSWALPERAHVLLGTPSDVLAAVRAGTVSLDTVQALVVDQAQTIEQLEGMESIEQVLQFLPEGTQRIVSALPVTPAVADFVERHLRRTVTVPTAHDPSRTPSRGSVRYRVVTDPADERLAELMGQLFEEGARHVLVFCRTEDRAADIGDRLTLRGFVAGAPGDPDAPVWLGVNALAVRSTLESWEGVVAVSADVPADPDTLDRRHGISAHGVVMASAREVPHLKDVALRTGYALVAYPAPSARGHDSVRELHATLESAIESEDIGPYLFALSPLFERYDPAEVAAAAVALLRTSTPPNRPVTQTQTGAATAPASAPSWAKLFISVGSRDGLVPGDLLGAVTGEAGVAGDTVGRIDIKESHALIEVHDTVAQKVIKALNGITIRGRSVRADFDRPRRNTPSTGRRKPPPRS